MSIYATLWILKFPSRGDAYTGCEWVSVIAQGVPGHIGTPTEGHGYENGDPAAFLPPAIAVSDDEASSALRAVVIVRENTEKVGQEYIGPLIVLSGVEYAEVSFETLHDRICNALRGATPRLVAQVIGSDGEAELMFDDGTVQHVHPQRERH